MSAARQLGLDDYVAAKLARDVGIARADSAAGEAWRASAVRAIRMCALDLSELTSDDVRKLCEDPPEPRAWGGAFKRAEALGYITATDRYHTPNRVSSHRRPMRVWRSLLKEAP